LQHGTLPLLGDVARIADVLVYPDEAARATARSQVRMRAAALAEIIGAASFETLWGRAAEAVIQGFAETFAVTFTTGSLSAAEAETAERLMNEVYGSQAYTRRR
jgi:lipoate-protein ligase A